MNAEQVRALEAITERLGCQDDVVVIADLEEQVELVVGQIKGRPKRVVLDAQGDTISYEGL